MYYNCNNGSYHVVALMSCVNKRCIRPSRMIDQAWLSGDSSPDNLFLLLLLLLLLL